MLFPPKLFQLMRNSLHSNSNHLKHQFLVLAWVQLARDFEKETKEYSRNPAQQPALKHANMPHFPTPGSCNFLGCTVVLNAVYDKTQLKTECFSVFTYLKQIVFTHTLIKLYAVDDKSPLPARWEKNVLGIPHCRFINSKISNQSCLLQYYQKYLS